MKKMLLLFAALLTLGLTTRAADGDEFTVDNLKYLVLSETEPEVSLIGYVEEPEGDLSIPAEVTNNGNSYSVTEIGESAFHFCTGLTSVTIPNSVTEIGSGAFSECYGLTSVTIPNSVTGIGIAAFSSCRSLQEIVVENGNKNYTSIDGVLYDSQITELITYPAGKEGAFDIPNSVTNIGVGAFYYCSGLTSVTIPNSVTNIGNAAFSVCESLTSVTIPNSVTNIGDWAFGGCSGLITIMSRPTTPPACYSRTFGNVPQSAVVYIPKGTLNEYAAAEGWNYFTDFRETEDSGIEGVEAGSDTASAEFFRLNGMRVKGGALAPGVYLKRQGGNVTKVLVK